MLRTRAPLSLGASSQIPSDLHVLGLPLAFILSQDQTLRKCLIAATALRQAQGPVAAHLVQPATGMGGQGCKFETDK